MILRMFALSLDPVHPLRFSLEDLRTFCNQKLVEYTAHHRDHSAGFIHRYPAIQCKQVRSDLSVMGISQGADCLLEIVRDRALLGAGESSCRILTRDPEIRCEEFGVTGSPCTYEFLTPWLALNQQNAKKFYDLKGKQERDAFMQKLLITQLNTLAKSLDYDMTLPISGSVKVRFIRERIERENMMVFLGKFHTNLRIPDHLGIGRLVSRGFGTIKCISESAPKIESDTYERSPAGH